ncbi:NUDIX domain-containing protein [Hallerella succinigenes]|uniref:GDP-mannose pyrophosphatase n=1 Tax=Hallerella succinigenes TaxID=1896222 RepID=A0A2M9A8T2_9BACT|nr:NUDIX domain-containing protein [Hallerella succinigenes]PJJ42017.1 NUDIX domain-containing protein [Hallerella succinigenes]
MSNKPVEYTFSDEVLVEDRDAVLNSFLFQNWLAHAQKNFIISKIHFSSVDYRFKNHSPLFIKLTATATLPDGKPVHGIVLVRGNAVGVLVVLRCEGKPYLLLVRQPRFAISEPESLEMPAGILDWSKDYRKVALSELKEEAMIDATDDELIDLTGFYTDGKLDGHAGSCGLLDERIRLYAIERDVTPEELKRLDGRNQEYTDENEWIKTVVLPYEEAGKQFIDHKNLLAMFMYERYLSAQGRHL